MNLREYRAAGGVVLDAEGRVLLIERWVLRGGEPTHEIRLPKGHVEPGERDEEAAVREVCEETGFCELVVEADLGEALSEFDWDEAHVLRHEHYYLMRLTNPNRGQPRPSHPGAEEALYRPRWAADLAEAEALLTFETERRFVRRAMEPRTR